MLRELLYKFIFYFIHNIQNIIDIFVLQYNSLIQGMCICNPSYNNSIFSHILKDDERDILRQIFGSVTQKRVEMLHKRHLIKHFGQHATVIYKGGNIYTMDSNNQKVEAIAIKHNKIFSVGKLEKVLQTKGQHTKIIDLGNKTMLPGFVEPHIHICFTMIDHWLDFGPYVNKNMEQIKQKLNSALKTADPNTLLPAQLFDPQIIPGEFDVSLNALDKISDKIGIFILESNGHVAHVNSAAFKLAGIDKNTKDPPHGRLIRDANGQLTGQIQQTAVVLFKKVFPKVSAKQYTQNFRKFLKRSIAKGCTSLHDCGIGYIDPKADLSVLVNQFSTGDAPVRYSGMLVSNRWKQWMQMKMKPDNGDEDLRINGVKCWADGSTQGGSAYLRQNYLVGKWGKGNANYDQDVLYKSIKQANDAGFQVGVHANGDAGIDMVLSVYERIHKQDPKPYLRHRIQHSTICHKQHLEKMKQLKISPSFLIGHIYYYGQVFQKILGKERAELMDPLKSAFKLGLTPTIHSDYNCQPVDPLRCIHNAVTRKIKINGTVINPSQCVTPYEAVQCMTINAAWQCHMEDIVGSLQQGKMADFVILDNDPMTIDPNDIINIKVLETWMDGRKTYDAIFTPQKDLKQQDIQKNNKVHKQENILKKQQNHEQHQCKLQAKELVL